MKYVIIHYNTPKLTLALLASLNKLGINKDIVIFENSNKLLLNANIDNNFWYSFFNNCGNSVRVRNIIELYTLIQPIFAAI